MRRPTIATSSSLRSNGAPERSGPYGVGSSLRLREAACNNTEQKSSGCANIQKRVVIKSKNRPEAGSTIVIVIVTVTAIVGVGFEWLLRLIGGSP